MHTRFRHKFAQPCWRAPLLAMIAKLQTLGALVVMLILFLSVVSVTVQAQDVTKSGTVAASFLKIGIGARATAMGEAFIATANDLSSVYWNPAGLAWVSGRQAYFTHSEWIADLQHDFAALSLNFENWGTVGVSFITLGAPDQEITTVEAPEGTGEFYTYQDLAFGLSYSRQLTDRFSFGISAKYISESLYRLRASAIAFDLGTLYVIPGTALRLGMSLTNFGTKMQFAGDNLERQIDVDPSTVAETDRATAFLKTERWDLPLNFKIALAYDFHPATNIRLTLGADAVNPNDNRENLNLGAEIGYREVVHLRLGYKGLNIDNHEGGFSAGGGLDTPLGAKFRAVVEYAYSELGRLNGVHRFGVGLKF